MDGARPVRAARGTTLTARSWQTEAPLRMLANNLDPEVAERPDDLVVYGGTGRAARDWRSYDAMVRTLTTLRDDETMLVQSGRPVGVMQTHEWAPRVLIANSNLVGDWANWPEFRRLERLGLTMYGQMTAGSWIYIGTQGILQGTYETFAAVAAKLAAAGRLPHSGGTLAGTITLTGGCGGMGGAQPLAVTLNGGVCLVVDVDEARLRAFAAEQPHADRIHFLPGVPPDEIAVWTAAADVSAMPVRASTLNHRLNTPTKLFDAMGAGTPVVASDLPGMAPIVRETGCGVLCDPADPRDVARAIREIVDSPHDRRAAFRDACLAAAAGPYSWTRQADVLVDLYRRLHP